MPDWSEGSIHAGELKIHYYRLGETGRPVVILNHGAGDDGLCWARVARALAAEYDLVLPDMRGHGKSGPGRGEYGSVTRAADLACLVEALELERPVIGGHSLGADTALHFAAARPERVRAIFLEDPPLFLPGETWRIGGRVVAPEVLVRQMANAMRLFRLLPARLAIPMMKKAQPAHPVEEIIAVANAQKRVSLDFIRSLPGLAREISGSVEVFTRVRVPALLITGDKERMAIVSQEAAARAAQLSPRVELVHLGGAGHNIRRERFDAYLEALSAFLKRVHSG